MTELLCLLQVHGINFNPKDSRIMCLPHIINLCSKHAMDNFASADFTAVPETSFESSGNTTIDKCAYVAALRRDPVARARDVVRIVRSSSLHRESFKDIILNGNAKKYWRDEERNVIELPALELIRDVKTRWDLRYQMARRLRFYRQVHCDDHSSHMSHFPTGYPVVLRVARTRRHCIVEVDRNRLDCFGGFGNGSRGMVYPSQRISQH